MLKKDRKVQTMMLRGKDIKGQQRHRKIIIQKAVRRVDDIYKFVR